MDEEKKLSSGARLEATPIDEEKSGSLETYYVDDKITALFARETSQVKRGLKQRHIQMIALAGTIGTGLFFATGLALSRGGPLGLLLAYGIVGVLTCFLIISIAELTALIPLSGGIVRPAEWFFDPALAFAQGWNSVYGNAILLPAELAACAAIIDFWTDINHAVWISILGVLLFISNLLFVGIYGELEFIFAMLKILLIIGINLMSLCITSGASPRGESIGFRYWRHPGPFAQYLGIGGSLGRFLGFWRVMNTAAYAYSSIENVSVAAAETENPRRNIPKAAKRVFWRVLLFYIVTIFFVGLIVPSNEKDLTASSSDASSSPFVIGATQAGIAVVPSIINAVVLTSAWSAGNSAMLIGTRTLYGLAQEGHAPKFFTNTNRLGTPWIAVLAVGSLMLLSYMTLSSGAATVFDWFQSLVSAASFVHWINMQIVYLRFYYGCKKQNIDRNRLPWKSPFQPYAAWISLVAFVILLLTGGFFVFIDGHWSTASFISSYFNIPLIVILYFGRKAWKRTKIVSLEEMPIEPFLKVAEAEPILPEPPSQGWRRLNILWG